VPGQGFSPRRWLGETWPRSWEDFSIDRRSGGPQVFSFETPAFLWFAPWMGARWSALDERSARHRAEQPTQKNRTFYKRGVRHSTNDGGPRRTVPAVTWALAYLAFCLESVIFWYSSGSWLRVQKTSPHSSWGSCARDQVRGADFQGLVSTTGSSTVTW
jgi:hypothetical protein